MLSALALEFLLPRSEMRLAFAAIAIGVGVSSSAPAQQPDSSAKADSLIRADSAARADSLLLARELRRIRGEPRARSADRATSSRTERSISARADLGLALSTPYLKDANGATVRAGIGPVASLGAAWTLGRLGEAPMAATVDLRAMRAGVRVEQGGTDTPAGSAWQVDLVAGLERWRGRVGLRAAAGVTWLRGDDDVSPFRFVNDTPWHLAGEVGALARLSRHRPVSVLVAAQGVRMGSPGNGLIDANGAVMRLVAAVRYGR